MLLANLVLAISSALLAVSVQEVLDEIKQKSESDSFKSITSNETVISFLIPAMILVILGVLLYFIVQACSALFDVHLILGVLCVFFGMHFLNIINLKFIKPRKLNYRNSQLNRFNLGFQVFNSNGERLIPVWILLVVFISMESGHWVNPLLVLILFSVVVSILLVLLVKFRELIAASSVKNTNYYELSETVCGLYLIITGLIIMSGNGYIIYSFFEKIFYMF